MPHSILIVDDEPGITVALMTRLEASGYTVYHAINGLAGVEAAAMHEPDLIIMDIRMPDINGFDACMRIKRLPRLADVPVIFMSANVKDETHRKALAAGAVEFIPKPYEAQHVLETVRRTLNAVSADATPSERGATVLVIDDEIGMMSAIQTRLESSGWTVLTARSGHEGLRVFHDNHVDLVVTDLHMPGGSGIDVATGIRESSTVPIIVLTGHKADFKRELRTVANVIEVLKPCETQQLLDTIESAVVLSNQTGPSAACPAA